jgi:hypothetical protein
MPGTLTALLIGAAVQATGNAKRAKAYFDMEPHLNDVVTMGEIAASLSTSVVVQKFSSFARRVRQENF